MGLVSAFGFGGQPGLPLPGGGSITLPAPYRLPPAHRAPPPGTDALIAYRKLHSTLAGTTECNGMIAIARADRMADLKTFVQAGRACLTTRWAYANESEGRWYGRPETFAEADSQGPNGEERTGPLKVHTVGWRVHDDPACVYAVSDRRGVMIAVWILDRHGGERRARHLAERIAMSFAG